MPPPMHARPRFWLSALLLTALLAAPATAQNPPPRGGANPLSTALDAYRKILQDLKLTADQQEAVRTVFDETVQSFRQMAPELRDATPQQRREKARDLLKTTAEEIASKLNDDQAARFRQSVIDLASNPQQPPRRATSQPAAKPDADAMMMAPSMTAAGASADSTAPKASPTTSLPQPLPAGSTAPELTAKRLDGLPVRLGTYKGRPFVLIFASYSVPSFRDKAAQINALVKDYRGRFEILVVYTAEAHPSDGWDVSRNRDDKVRITQHKTETERLANARDAKTALKLDATMLVDEMSNLSSTAYAAGPNSAYLVARDGTIVLSQPWFEPWGLRAAIDETLKPTTRPSPSATPK